MAFQSAIINVTTIKCYDEDGFEDSFTESRGRWKPDRRISNLITSEQRDEIK